MLKNHLKSDNAKINNNFVQILTSLIKFILDCNTLTRLETSSSWVHCSNEAEMGPELLGFRRFKMATFGRSPRGDPGGTGGFRVRWGTGGIQNPRLCYQENLPA